MIKAFGNNAFQNAELLEIKLQKAKNILIRRYSLKGKGLILSKHTELLQNRAIGLS